MYKGKLCCVEHGDDIIIEKPFGSANSGKKSGSTSLKAHNDDGSALAGN